MHLHLFPNGSQLLVSELEPEEWRNVSSTPNHGTHMKWEHELSHARWQAHVMCGL